MAVPTSLRISFLYVAGAFGGRYAGSPETLCLAIWLYGQVYANATHLRVTTLERGRAPQDCDHGASEFWTLASLLQLAGIPDRTPCVRGAVDSSDDYAITQLRVTCDKAVCNLDLHLMSSGFEGEDSVALRRFFHALFTMAGVEDKRPWADLTDGDR